MFTELIEWVGVWQLAGCISMVTRSSNLAEV